MTYYLGIDLGGSHITVGRLLPPERITARRSIEWMAGKPFSELIETMEQMCREVLTESGWTECEPVFVGVATPGELDLAGGIVRHAYNLDLHDAPLCRALESRFFQASVFLVNDADAATYAEWRAGNLRPYRTAWLLTLGTGVGGGLILGGKLFTGGRGAGIEPGHMTLCREGSLCTCGNRGCVETLCSGTWLAGAAVEAGTSEPKSLVAECMRAGVPAGGKLVIDCAKAGDPTALGIFEKYVAQLGTALVSLIALTDPEAIALGGGVGQAGEFLYQPLAAYVDRHNFFSETCPIIGSHFGSAAGVVGAAWLAASHAPEESLCDRL